MKRVVAGALLCLLVACSGGSPDHPLARPSKRHASEPGERDKTRPAGPSVTNEALGPSHRHVRQAIADLKRIGLWDRLTRRLFVINFDSRLGRDDIPTDGHLADAYFGVLLDIEKEGGTSCDIMFFTTAISDDLGRWRSYYSQGLIDEAPPDNLRQFWGSLMAHELGHCQEGPHGEPAAEVWEKKARDLLRDSQT